VKSKPPYGLSQDEYEFIEALVDTVIPPGKDPIEEPGAKQVGTKNYFDSRFLELSEPEKSALRRCFSLLEEKCFALFGVSFKDAEREKREKVLNEFLSDPQSFKIFFKLRAICLEGYYSDYRDPWYKGKTAWDVVEFSIRKPSLMKKDFSFLMVYKLFNKEGTNEKTNSRG
jgi:hypothetical protein